MEKRVMMELKNMNEEELQNTEGGAIGLVDVYYFTAILYALYMSGLYSLAF